MNSKTKRKAYYPCIWMANNLKLKPVKFLQKLYDMKVRVDDEHADTLSSMEPK